MNKFTKGKPTQKKRTKIYSSTGMFSAETRCFGWGKKLLLGAAALGGGALLNHAIGDPLGINPYFAKAGGAIGDWFRQAPLRKAVANNAIIANPVPLPQSQLVDAVKKHTKEAKGAASTAANAASAAVSPATSALSGLAQTVSKTAGREAKVAKDKKPRTVQIADWKDVDGVYTPSYENGAITSFINKNVKNLADKNDQGAMLDQIEAQINASPTSAEVPAIDQALKGIAINAQNKYLKERAENLYKSLHGIPATENLDYGSVTSLQEIKEAGDAAIHDKKKAALDSMTKEKEYAAYQNMLAKSSRLNDLVEQFKASPYLNTPQGDAIYAEAESIINEINSMPFDDLKTAAASKRELLRALASAHDGQTPPATARAVPAAAASVDPATAAQQEQYYASTVNGANAFVADKDPENLMRLINGASGVAMSYPFGPARTRLEELIGQMKYHYNNLVYELSHGRKTNS